MREYWWPREVFGEDQQQQQHEALLHHRHRLRHLCQRGHIAFKASMTPTQSMSSLQSPLSTTPPPTNRPTTWPTTPPPWPPWCSGHREARRQCKRFSWSTKPSRPPNLPKIPKVFYNDPRSFIMMLVALIFLLMMVERMLYWTYDLQTFTFILSCICVHKYLKFWISLSPAPPYPAPQGYGAPPYLEVLISMDVFLTIWFLTI